jgi:hypothetical protein
MRAAVAGGPVTMTAIRIKDMKNAQSLQEHCFETE